MNRIHRLILTTLISLFLSNSFVFAQKRASIGVSYEAGVSTYFFVSDININNDIVNSNFLRTNGFGLVFTYTDDLVGVQIGAKQIPKGWVENFKNGASAEFKINYLEIPIMTHMRFGRRRKSGLILNYGLFIAKALNHSVTMEGGKPDYTRDTSYINYDNPTFNEFEYGIKGGIGYEFEIGKHNIQAQIMFTQGMRDLFEPDRVKLYRSLSQTITAGIIYKFSFYRKASEKDKLKSPKVNLERKKKKQEKKNKRKQAKQEKEDKKEQKAKDDKKDKKADKEVTEQETKEDKEEQKTKQKVTKKKAKKEKKAKKKVTEKKAKKDRKKKLKKNEKLNDN